LKLSCLYGVTCEEEVLSAAAQRKLSIQEALQTNIRRVLGPPGQRSLLLRSDYFFQHWCPPAGSLVAAMTGTDDLLATTTCRYLHNGGFERSPLRFHIPKLPRDAQEILPEVGVKDLLDRDLSHTFPVHPCSQDDAAPCSARLHGLATVMDISTETRTPSRTVNPDSTQQSKVYERQQLLLDLRPSSNFSLVDMTTLECLRSLGALTPG
ncbi:hypothetical protein L3Q82_012842, partial [Scortum barcoo]